MFRSILGIIAPSPFKPFAEMAEKVEACAQLIPVLLDAYLDGNEDRVREIAEEISHLEHEADVAKTTVRDSLPRSILLPVDRRDMLEALSSLDAIADCAEDVAIMFTLRRMEPHEPLIAPLKSLVRRVMAVVTKCMEVVRSLEEEARLTGFANGDAHRLRSLIDELGRLEHEADVVQDELSRQLFAIEDDIKPASLLMWGKIFNKIGDMANHAERTGNRLRLFVAE